MDMSNMREISTCDFNKAHSKTLYRSICVPSTVQLEKLKAAKEKASMF